ncbi:17L [Yaba monkey tumor virus]|uniref:Deoxyuridine 5'-triphosphate nucleotidohydrolase n=1 Tax=Yaba monkey tumor virus (strain VR587) TaxID=928314 RepID=DUT_YMTV5|nr:dUTPase [Yaba monkey tumor virus]Q6TUZ4.1 RecName: Full=Deoxyuridine 5'-triphosphate nucleotidohydrolase; Short=dUTPase; AltName: Full=dUTP pyrophosphatase [Yaba monkey tumor virus strain VR587]AAR07375.1 17L [Yaba monkey tumor virus]
MSKFIVYVKKSSEFATIPTRSSKKSAGYDLYSAYDYLVRPKSRVLVKTDICLSIPDECYGRIASRSGLSLNNSIDIGGGVIDGDYRGVIGVIFINNGNSPHYIKRGDRIAQIVFERLANVEIKEISNLDCTCRGDCGFGSSGI